MRIVKSGASTVWSDGCGTLINIKDTVLIDKNWRPEDWAQTKFNLCRDSGCAVTTGEEKAEQLCPSCSMPHARVVEAGFQACLEAIEKI